MVWSIKSTGRVQCETKTLTDLTILLLSLYIRRHVTSLTQPYLNIVQTPRRTSVDSARSSGTRSRINVSGKILEKRYALERETDLFLHIDRHYCLHYTFLVSTTTPRRCEAWSPAAGRPRGSARAYGNLCRILHMALLSIHSRHLEGTPAFPVARVYQRSPMLLVKSI